MPSLDATTPPDVPAPAPPTVVDGTLRDGPPPQPRTLPYQERPGTAEAPLAGRSYGRYTLLHEHARGGLGRVAVARDDALRRQVALKEIRPDRHPSPDLVRRFVNEAVITGMLEHPGIVPVYALEENDQGRPYYAMRFIQGRTLSTAITGYHQQPEPLLFRELLQHFVTVCQTVAYAHSRGVIHRDLKPDNIMLGAYGETLVVDWGLAKQVARAPGAEAATAGPELPPDPGTLAPSDPTCVDVTREGAVLGTPGYMAPEQARGEIDRLGPATDIYALGSILYALLTGRAPFLGPILDILPLVQRGTPPPSPHTVKAEVPRPLEAVCLQALAPAPAHRYAQAADLAKDVERFLADEPVQAWREPWTQRARRWLRRHRALALSAVVMLGLVLAGSVLGAVLLGLKNRELDDANTALRTAHAQEKEQRTRAERHYRLAKEAVDNLFVTVTDEPMLRQEAMRPVRKLLLEKAMPFYDSFQRQPESDAVTRRDAARSLMRLGIITDEIGNRAKARQAFDQALQLFRGLLASSPDDPALLHDLSQSWHFLAILQSAQGELAAAEQSFEEARRLTARLVAFAPADPLHLRLLGARYNSVGNIQYERGRLPEARASLTQALYWSGKHVQAKADDPLGLMELATAHSNLGLVLADLGKAEDALHAHVSARKLRDRLVREHPENAEYQNDLASTWNNLGALHLENKAPAQALPCLEQAVSLRERLATLYPGVHEFRHRLASSCTNRGHVLDVTGKPAEAEASFLQAIRLLERLIQEQPSIVDYRYGLAAACLNHGMRYLGAGQAAQALPRFAQARTLLEALLATAPGSVRIRLFVRNACTGQAEALEALGRHGEAVPVWEQALARNDQARNHAWYQHRHAQALLRSGDVPGAVAAVEAVVKPDKISGGAYVLMAGLYAQAAALTADTARQEQYAARAVALLRRAKDLGQFRDARQRQELRQSKEFHLLRNRTDFQELLREPGKK